MITLYHGSNMAFSVPDLSVGRQGMDFGKGSILRRTAAQRKRCAHSWIWRSYCPCLHV